MVSWIHESDFARSVQFLIENEELDGIFNIAAPAAIRNREFMKTIRRQARMPIGLPTPESELALKSRFVAPERLMQNRFQFHFPFIDEALADLDEQIASAKTCPRAVAAQC